MKKARVGLVLGPLLFLLILLLPPPAGASAQGRAMLAVLAWVATWWMTEAVPLAAASLLPLVLFPLLGVLTPLGAAAPYAEPAVFLFLGGFLLAKAFESSGLHERVALRILSFTGPDPRGILLGAMAATALMSMWVSNTATALIMLPIAASVAARSPGRFPALLMLGVAYAASLGGMATLVGTPPNALFAGQARALGEPVGFGQWMLLAAPVAAVLLALAWLYLSWLARREPRSLDTARHLDERHAALGPATRAQRIVLAVFLATVALWVFRQDLDLGILVVPGWATRLGLDVHDATIAIAAALVLFVAPAGRGRRVLEWDEAARIPWEVLILFGGGFALAEGFRAAGLGPWLAAQVEPLAALPLPAMLVGLALLVVVASEIASNTALAALLLPVLASAAPGLGADAMVLMATATLAASCGFMLPVATPPNAVAFASGHVRAGEMARVGVVLDLASVLVVPLMVLWLAPLALGGA